MGFRKMHTVNVDGISVKPVEMPTARRGTNKKDAKAWRRTAPVHKAKSRWGLAVVAIVGCAAGYILLAQPTMDANAIPAFAWFSSK